MMTSGWILPDFREIKCVSCSSLNGHVDIVKRYLDNLKIVDKRTYDKIVQSFYIESSKVPTLGLDDFAVIKLGWVKVNNVPTKVIFFTEDKETEFIINNYLDFGYYPVCLNAIKPIIQIYTPSHKLI